MKSTRYYKISELSRISSVPIPTIRFYIREGLLAPAIKTGKTVAFFHDAHLERLGRIKKLRKEDGKSIAHIREELGRMPAHEEMPENAVITSSGKRDVIVAAAIALFIKKGLSETSIDDIVNDARIGKGTFYRYFRDKTELFLECADSVFHDLYSNVWQEIRRERDIRKRMRKRAEAFFDSYPRWIDMMNQLRYASVSDDRFFREKFHSVLDQIVAPIARDLEVLKKEGGVPPDLDCREAAYTLMGMAEYSAALIQGKAYSAAEVVQLFMDFALNGLKK